MFNSPSSFCWCTLLYMIDYTVWMHFIIKCNVHYYIYHKTMFITPIYLVTILSYHFVITNVCLYTTGIIYWAEGTVWCLFRRDGVLEVRCWSRYCFVIFSVVSEFPLNVNDLVWFVFNNTLNNNTLVISGISVLLVVNRNTDRKNRLHNCRMSL